MTSARTPGPATTSTGPRYVVGIGASAGGIPALKQFFDHTPAGHGLAFVVIQHLHPSAESAMAKILHDHSAMHVEEIQNGVRVEADHIYLLPPGKSVALHKGTLRLEDRVPGREGNFPIDAFFTSLADDQAERGIAVILTGSGTDGSKGLREVKARGGIVLAQAPSEAEHPSMPESAIATGSVDIVAPVEALPGHIRSYTAHFPPTVENVDGIEDVRTLFRTRVGMDLHAYKPGTLTRRVLRRMSLRNAPDMAAYVHILSTDPRELDQLRKDILIGVTTFFRDPEAFATLETEVIPRLFEGAEDREVRVWVSGCSTGEEAYSIAMLLREHLEKNPGDTTARVFATDANEDAIEIARAGIYDEAAMNSVQARRTARFFQQTPEGRYRVDPELRNMVTFAVQDLISDPPFPRLDLICCRNVLIYLEPAVQSQLLQRFHFALRTNGYLFLGRSESVPAETPFKTLSSRWRIFQRQSAPTRATGRISAPLIRPLRSTTGRGRPPSHVEPTPMELAGERLLSHYAPVAVVIDAQHNILCFHGDTSRYLQLPHGDALLDLSAMFKPELQSHGRTAIYRALREKKPIRVTGATITDDGKTRAIDILVEPLFGEGSRNLFLVIFEDAGAPSSAHTASVVVGERYDDAYVRQIEAELKATKDDLVETVESADAQHEELQAANEEVTSMNEELRAANEELMASKEELQALNEELSLRNSQLSQYVESLQKATDDLDNLLSTTGIATLFLDRSLRIIRASPALRPLVNVRANDAGRPLQELTWRFSDPDLLSDASAVLSTLSPREKEIHAEDDHRYVRRIIPYHSHDAVDGVLITFTDVEASRTSTDTVERALALAEGIVSTFHEPLVLLDHEARIVSANAAFSRVFDLDPATLRGSTLHDLDKPSLANKHLSALIDQSLRENRETDTCDLDQDGRRYSVTAHPLPNPLEGPLVLLTFRENAP